MIRLRHCLLAIFCLVSVPVLATLPTEEMFLVETVGSREGRHIVVLADFAIPQALDGRSHILDADSGEYLGAINAGFWHSGVLLPRTRDVIVSPETYFSRGSRGERSDIFAFYDANTLDFLGETEIPPKRFTAVKAQGSSALSDDDRFAFLLNHTPAASITVVDLETREFVTEVDIPGCFNLYAVGARRLNALCSHGGFMTIEFDDSGNVISATRSEALFEAYEDPITVSGVRVGDTWYYVSKAGYVHGFRSDDSGISALPKWSLFTDKEREDDWRISGFQHLAIHGDSGRVYALVHQGGPETFEDPGTHVWVYDLESGRKIDELELERMALSIEVSQDADAQLYALAADFNIPELFQIYIYLTEGAHALEKIADFVLDVYGAQSGELLRSIKEVGAFPTYIQVWPANKSEGSGD